MKTFRILNVMARICADIAATLLFLVAAICLGLISGRVSQMSLTVLDPNLNLPLIS